MNETPNPSSSSSSSQKPICIVCYEDLHPLTELLQCVPTCGHVLHELCLQQWVEYCGKKPTCPVCKQACGTAGKKPTRLYFQSTGDDVRKDQDDVGATSSAELKDEVAGLERKVEGLKKSVEAQHNMINNIVKEVEVTKNLLENEKMNAEKLKREKQVIQQLLNIKIEEISRKTMECTKLQEKSLSLAKELASLKLATDMNLGEEEITKFASLGNSMNPQNALEILKKSLAMRNRSYKELMVQCNILGRSESKTKQKLEKAKELIKKLKVRLLEMEKENEERENEILRDLKSNKKPKLDINFEQETYIDLKNENSFIIEKENFERNEEELRNDSNWVKGISLIDSKDDNFDENISSDKIEDQNHNNNFCNGTKEDLRNDSIWVKGISLIDSKDDNSDPIFSSDKIEAQNHNMNFCTGSKSKGKWCKIEPKISNKRNGDLISIGADGRGGKIKILRSLNQFQDDKGKEVKKVGGKGGQSQIEQFFGKR